MHSTIVPRRRARVFVLLLSPPLLLFCFLFSFVLLHTSAYSDSPGAVAQSWAGRRAKKDSACVAGEWRIWRSAPTFWSCFLTGISPPFRGRIEGNGHPCRPESLCRPMAGHPLVQSTCRRMGRNGGSTCAGGRSKRGTSTRWDSRSCFRSAMHESGLLSRSVSPLVQFRPVSVQSSIVARERDIRSVWLWFWLTSPRTQWGHRCPTLPLCCPWSRPSLITHTC